MKTVVLHSTQGGSDKVYLLKIVRHKGQDLFDVIYANGRRSAGATAGNKAKNNTPIPYHYAEALMQEVIDEKRYKKGYHNLGGCTLCGGTKAAFELLKANPDVVKKLPSNQPSQSEMVKAYAPTWYERTIDFDDQDV